jgi:hypothetical protein
MKSDRSIAWCQQKILLELDQKQEIRTYLALSALVLEKGVRSVQESRNLNVAITNLMIDGQIKRTKDQHGCIVYRLIVRPIDKKSAP